jgi:hypothetical protein
MTWVKIDDGYYEHPKLALAGPLAELLWIRGLAYCNRNLTDGFIPYAVARTLVSWRFLSPFDEQPDGARKIFDVAIASGMGGEDVDCDLLFPYLVNAGLWEQVPGGFAIHDYLDHQPSKADVERERASARDRMKRVRGQGEDKSRGSSADVRANGTGSSPNPVPVPHTPATSEETTNEEALPSAFSEDRDSLDRYYELVGSRLWGKPAGQWLKDLEASHGLVHVVAALEVEHKADGRTKDLVGRVAARLERQADRVAQAEAKKPKPVDPLLAEIGASLAASGHYEDAGPVVDLEAGRKLRESFSNGNGKGLAAAAAAVIGSGRGDRAAPAARQDVGTSDSSKPTRASSPVLRGSQVAVRPATSRSPNDEAPTDGAETEDT